MSAKVLFWDIETAPILAYVWGTFDQNVALNQIHTDWHVLSWSAKWKDDKKVMYMDQRNAKDITDDKKILGELWKLLDEADVVITQNGIQFDAKKVNARFIQHGMKPPSPYKHVDTLRLAKKQFGFTSNKLEYMTKKLCTKYKKLDHGKFPGFTLWQECLKGNKKAWKEMEEYNRHDVLALEELYGKLAPWGAGYDPNIYTEEFTQLCVCGSSSWRKHGFSVSRAARYQNYQCTSCGCCKASKINLIPPDKAKSLRDLKETERRHRLEQTGDRMRKQKEALRELKKEREAAKRKSWPGCPKCGGENCSKKACGAKFINGHLTTYYRCTLCFELFPVKS